MLTSSEHISGQLVTSLVSGPVFAAEWNETNRTLTVHTCAKAARRSATETGSDTRIAIRTHSRRALQSPRSLEALTLAGSETKIVYDPTQIFTRAGILVRVAKTARAKLQGQIAGCYFQAASRTLLVVPQASVEATGYDALKRSVGAILAEVDGKSELGGIAVRVTRELARDSLAVDNLSVRPARYLRGVLRTAVAAVFSTGMIAGAAAHAGTPANHGLLGGLSVFADGITGTAADGFVSTGMAFFFGEDGASSQIELQLAQTGPGNTPPGLRIVVNPERQVEDGPELRRPSWAPYSNGAGPGGGNAAPGNAVGTSS